MWDHFGINFLTPVPCPLYCYVSGFLVVIEDRGFVKVLSFREDPLNLFKPLLEGLRDVRSPVLRLPSHPSISYSKNLIFRTEWWWCNWVDSTLIEEPSTSIWSSSFNVSWMTEIVFVYKVLREVEYLIKLRFSKVTILTLYWNRNFLYLGPYFTIYFNVLFLILGLIGWYWSVLESTQEKGWEFVFFSGPRWVGCFKSRVSFVFPEPLLRYFQFILNVYVRNLFIYQIDCERCNLYSFFFYLLYRWYISKKFRISFLLSYVPFLFS